MHGGNVRNWATVGAAGLASVLALQTAEARSFRIAPDAPERLAPVTGARGGLTLRIDAPTAGRDASPVLMALVVDEKLDRPCFVRAKFGDGVQSAPILLPPAVDLCPDGLAAGVASAQPAGVAELPWGHAVREAVVCLSRNGDRVKGLRLFGHRLGGNADYPDEAFIPGTRTAEFKLVNCDSWSPPSACKSGEAATGVVLHFQEEGRNRQRVWLSGLQLVCRPAT